MIELTAIHKLEELKKYISNSCDTACDNIVLSAIGLGMNNYWQWIVQPKSDGCANIFCLLKNSRFLIRDNDIAYYFCNNKKEAVGENKYFPDQRDIVSNCVGSFILWEVDNNAELIDNNTEHDLPRKTMVCVSTYGTKLIEDEDAREFQECYKNITNALMRCDFF